MNSIGVGLSTGVQQGYLAARRVFDDPQEISRQRTYQDRANAYALLWSYYNNSLFDRGSAAWNVWSAYKSVYTLYRNIRMIYNPVRRLVDFYAGQVYPGVLSYDGKPLPDGMTSAIPFSPDTPAELTQAIGQFWQWSNWQAKKAVEVRYGAALGSLLVEVIDDIEHGKVTANIVWPGFLTDLELDSAGNVKSYVTEYLAYDDQGAYTYRKQADGNAFRYFRNDEPFAYNGGSAVVSNPYGFVPAVWIKHADTGSDQGSPAVAGSLGKIDELNNLASHVHDQIHKVIGAPIVLWSSGGIVNLFGKNGATKKRGATEDLSDPTGDQESVLMLSGPQGGSVDSLAGNLSLADTAVYMDRLLGEIEQDHPELVFYRELRSMSQVTGPAASRLVGDVASRVSESTANYDRANIALFQMAAAIGGFRANNGAWGTLTRQQEKFRPFDLSSYERGDLDLTILPRPLLVPTKLEMAQEKQALWLGMHAAIQAGAPLEFALQDAGFTEEELARLMPEPAPVPVPALPPVPSPTPALPAPTGGGQ